MTNRLRDESGIALILTLLVVALLTITVVEFTYSVEVDQHMARNALNGLQASLLARSGINLGEAFLLHDADPLVDAFTEDWCPQADADAHSCLIDETSGQVVLPENMRLRVQIVDEQGKFNLNLTKPQNYKDCVALRTWHGKGSDPTTATAPYESAEILFGHLLEGRADPQIADALGKYWDSICDSVYGPLGGPPPPPAVALLPNQVPDMASLDDAGIIGLDPDAIRRLRPVLTALPNPSVGVNPCRFVNLNTAPRQVLQAICSDSGPVDSIIEQRRTTAVPAAEVGKFIQECKPAAAPGAAPPASFSQIGVTSCFYLIRASAIVNPNPITGLGGIGRSASMLVRRYQVPPANPLRFRLERKEWQKEGGARLFQPNQEPGIEDEPTPSGG